MKYFLIILILLANYAYANADVCNRNFEVFIVEKGKGKLKFKSSISLINDRLFIDDMEYPENNFSFSFPIRYDQGKMYTGYKNPLNDIHLMISDGSIRKKVLAVSITKDKRITIADSPRETGPSFSNMSFDENGNIFQLSLSMEVKDNCKITASAELLNGTYMIDSGRLLVNTDNSYFTMKGPKIDL